MLSTRIPHDYPNIIADIGSNHTTNFIGLASYTILIWDHLITFGDEVKYIWNAAQKGTIIYLFLILRYLVPFAFIVNLYAYFSSSWTPESCDRFVRYEGVLHVAEICTVAYMMMLRVSAFYATSRIKWIGWCLTGYIVVEIGVMSFILIHGKAVVHHPSSGVEACTMIFSDAIPPVASSTFAWMPLLYDTIVLLLTLYRTKPPDQRRDSRLLGRILKEGLLYWIVIFALAFSLTIMMVFSSNPGIKNVMGQMTQLLTVVMMCRITLHLKKFGSKSEAYEYSSKGVRRLSFESTQHRQHVTTLEWRATEMDPSNSDSFALPTVTADDIPSPPPIYNGKVKDCSPGCLQPPAEHPKHQVSLHNDALWEDPSSRPSTSTSTQCLV